MTTITNTTLGRIADSPELRKMLSPMVQPSLDEIHALHLANRTAARMHSVRESFMFHATAADLQKIAKVFPATEPAVQC